MRPAGFVGLTLARTPPSWQLILADLSLILFLVSAAALSGSKGTKPGAETAASGSDAAALAPAQALYRPGPGLPTLAEWLAAQPRDPRAALTILAEHARGEEERAWSDARAMAATASALGVRSRVIIRQSERSAIHASLAYDQPAL